ncbi:MAG: amino acid ABC transporter substrate-binding protein [Pseudomonadota bacterium]
MKYLISLFVTSLLLISVPLAIADSSTLESIKQSGKIKIGYRQSEPPMSFTDKEGNPIGYSIDLCNRIAANISTHIGKEIDIEYIPVSAENRFTSIVDGKIDILCGSTTKTLSRSELVDFTQDTFVTGASFMTLKGEEFSELAELDGKIIGVVENTTTEKTLKEMLNETLTNADVITYKSAKEALDALRDKKIAAFTSDQVVLIGLAITAEDKNNLAITPQVYSFEPFALAVKRNDADFRLIANSALSQLNRTGQIFQIYNKWFGGFSKDMPPLHEALYQLNATPE